MPYYRPIKTIASVAGLPGVSAGGVVVIVSEMMPDARETGAPLQDGDFWFQPSPELTYIYADGKWQIIGSNVDYGGDFIIDGGDSTGNGFINNNPGDGSGSTPQTTADLPLDLFVEENEDAVRLTDLPREINLPPFSTLKYQSDANEWLLKAVLIHQTDIETIQEEIEDLNNVGLGFEFKTTAPITVDKVETIVTHGFDMRNLTPIN